MKISCAFLVVALAASGCTAAKSSELSGAVPTSTRAATAPSSSPAVTAKGEVVVQMTAATLGEECGGTGTPYSPPPQRSEGMSLPAPAREKSAPGPAGDSAQKSSMSERRVCQQTSMQLSIVTPAGGEGRVLRVKKVELFDDAGTKIGDLTPRTPMVWSEKVSEYTAWNEKVAPGANLAVSYALSAPNWSGVPNRWAKTYVIKAVVTVDGSDQSVQHTAEPMRIESPTHLPPGAVT